MPKYKFHHVWHPRKKFQTCKEAEKINHNEEENNQLETDSEIAQMIELREKNVKVAMINIFHMFNHEHDNKNSFRRD